MKKGSCKRVKGGGCMCRKASGRAVFAKKGRCKR
jgi:hypothetical protein